MMLNRIHQLDVVTSELHDEIIFWTAKESTMVRELDGIVRFRTLSKNSKESGFLCNRNPLSASPYHSGGAARMGWQSNTDHEILMTARLDYNFGFMGSK